MPNATSIAIVDDETLLVDAIARQVQGAATTAAEISCFGSPNEFIDVAKLNRCFDVVVVDLSFGAHPIAAAGGDVGTGVDVVDAIVNHSATRTLVLTRNDTRLHNEMCVAIRQTWRQVSFLHKTESLERLAEVVLGCSHQGDSGAFTRLFANVQHVDPQSIRSVLEQTTRYNGIKSVLLALADFPTRPSLDELLAAVDGVNSRPYLQNLLNECGQAVVQSGLIEAASATGIHRLWYYGRARRAILRRVLA